MTRQARRLRDRAARERRRVTRLVREGTGRITGMERRAHRLTGRTERMMRVMSQLDLQQQLAEAVA